jgi:hypothetical protein
MPVRAWCFLAAAGLLFGAAVAFAPGEKAVQFEYAYLRWNRSLTSDDSGWSDELANHSGTHAELYSVLSGIRVKSAPGLIKVVNAVAADGWEVVSVSHGDAEIVMYFRRALRGQGK